MRPSTVKKCSFMSILYSKTLREYRKPTFKLVIECESQSMTCFLTKVTSPSLQEKYLRLDQLQQENHQHTQSKLRLKARVFKANSIKKS